MNFKYVLFLLLILLFYFYSCGNKSENNNNSLIVSKPDSSGLNSENLKNIYRYYNGTKDKFKIWIVDGAKVRKQIFNEFIYGGNSERYPFIPEDEIWIDTLASSMSLKHSFL